MDAVARVQTWIDERLNVGELVAPLREKTVPVHRYSQWYFLGGLTLFLFTVQLCSGVLLLLYYRPSANEAFESVQNITNHVQFGWLVRSVHFLVGEPDGLLRICSHVQRGFRPSVPQAARTHLDDRHVPVIPRAGIWFQWLPVALEYTGLFCDQGRDRSCGTGPGGWSTR